MGKTYFPKNAQNPHAGPDLLNTYSPDRGWPLGNVFFVHSGGSNGSGRGLTPDAPLASIDYAVGLCTHDNDDHIIVLPTHVETVVAAGGLAVDVRGVTIRGIGNGNRRPKINFTTATGASLDITAAGCTLENLYLKNAIDAQTAMINVKTAGQDTTLRGLTIELADATTQAAVAILTDATADRLLIEKCRIFGTLDAGATEAISLVGGNDIVIQDNFILGAFTTSVGCIRGQTTDSLRMSILNNVLANGTASSTKVLVLTATSTGVYANNRMGILSGTAPVTGAAMTNGGGNYYSAAAGVAAGTLA